MNGAFHTGDFRANWQVRLLTGPPLIAPARQFVFPIAVPGEEDAMARGALWLEVKPGSGAAFLAQCALGFAGNSVAHGAWTTPCPDTLLAVAGGYAYRINTAAPERTVLLPMRPVVSVLSAVAAEALILLGFHHVAVLAAEGMWESPRLSWEGVAVTGMKGDELHGTGWHMRTDRELPFVLNLRSHELIGGAYLP